jgi:hypothetical protein
VVELIDIARVSGAVQNIPEEDSPAYAELLELAALDAAKFYGEWGVQTGQINQQANMKEMEHQMQREADSGELDEWGMEEFDPDMRSALAGQVGDITNGS